MNRFMKVAIGVAALAVSGTAGATAAALHQNSASAPHVYRARAADPQLKPESLFVPIDPCRVIDTRQHGAGGKLTKTQVRNFYVAGTVGFPAQGGHSGGCGIPSSATAVAIAFKVVNPTSVGILRAWPDGTTQPDSTTLSWAKGLSLGDASTQKITAGPGLDLSIGIVSDPVHIVADVTGYYVPQIQAEIGAGGSIDSGTSRVVSVSHVTNSGLYYVTLDRPARQCSIGVSQFNGSSTGAATVGLSSASTPNVISVITAGGDRPFFLQVSC